MMFMFGCLRRITGFWGFWPAIRIFPTWDIEYWACVRSCGFFRGVVLRGQWFRQPWQRHCSAGSSVARRFACCTLPSADPWIVRVLYISYKYSVIAWVVLSIVLFLVVEEEFRYRIWLLCHWIFCWKTTERWFATFWNGFNFSSGKKRHIYRTR